MQDRSICWMMGWRQHPTSRRSSRLFPSDKNVFRIQIRPIQNRSIRSSAVTRGQRMTDFLKAGVPSGLRRVMSSEMVIIALVLLRSSKYFLRCFPSLTNSARLT